ncbi:MAG: hypothetical protein ABI591_33815 [Kofleriaceae bacterium]
MGLTGTFLFVEHASARAVCDAVAAHCVVVDTRPLAPTRWAADRNLLGLALVASEGWVHVVTSDRSIDAELAAALAHTLGVAVVINGVYEICDPVEPETVHVYGAAYGARFEGLAMQLAPQRYSHLANTPGVELVTVRSPTPCDHEEAWRLEPRSDEEPVF